MAYDKLFEPGYIGKVKIKNRLVMSPMNTHFSIGDPAVLSERYFEYYKARARGGVGLIITTLCHLSQIKYFNEITEMAHRYDAKIAIELSPGTGRLADATLLRYWVCRELIMGKRRDWQSRRVLT